MNKSVKYRIFSFLNLSPAAQFMIDFCLIDIISGQCNKVNDRVGERG